jgi:hypothetical protein
MRLDCMKSFEVEKGLDEPLTGRVTLHHCHNIGQQCLAKIGLSGERTIKGRDQCCQTKDVVLQPKSDAIESRSLERRLIKNRIHKQPTQHRCALVSLSCFIPHLRPKFLPGNGLLAGKTSRSCGDHSDAG